MGVRGVGRCGAQHGAFELVQLDIDYLRKKSAGLRTGAVCCCVVREAKGTVAVMYLMDRFTGSGPALWVGAAGWMGSGPDGRWEGRTGRKPAGDAWDGSTRSTVSTPYKGVREHSLNGCAQLAT